MHLEESHSSIFTLFLASYCRCLHPISSFKHDSSPRDQNWVHDRAKWHLLFSDCEKNTKLFPFLNNLYSHRPSLSKYMNFHTQQLRTHKTEQNRTLLYKHTKGLKSAALICRGGGGKSAHCLCGVYFFDYRKAFVALKEANNEYKWSLLKNGKRI